MLAYWVGPTYPRQQYWQIPGLRDTARQGATKDSEISFGFSGDITG